MEKHVYDYLVLGAGPAGAQIGYFMQRAGHDYLILEGGDKPAAFFAQFPRHRNLISSNKVYTGYEDPEINLRFDWNSLLSDDPSMRMKKYSQDYFPRADKLVEYVGDFVKHFGLTVRYNTRIEKITKNGHFELTSTDGETFHCRRLIVATGVSRPWLPPIPGIELTENYMDVPVDPQDFVNQRVLILGKGNSGFEIADALISTTALIHVASRDPIKMAWKTHHPGHLRAVNNNLLDTYQLKSQNAILDGTVQKIEKGEDGKLRVTIHYSHAEEENEVLVYDRVIVCTGFRFDASIFADDIKPALWNENRLPEMTSGFESTNVPGLYFAGTLTAMRDYKKSSSPFIHGFRYNAQALFRMLETKYHGKEWPSQEVGAESEELVDAVLERINKTSALWQLFGFMADVIVLPEEEGQKARYYHELPKDYVMDSDFSRNRAYLVVSLEFGKVVGDPFNILRHPDPTKAERSVFLHPVVRAYRGKEQVGELHLLENLFGEWWDPELHVKPLFDFMNHKTREMAAATAG